MYRLKGQILSNCLKGTVRNTKWKIAPSGHTDINFEKVMEHQHDRAFSIRQNGKGANRATTKEFSKLKRKKGMRSLGTLNFLKSLPARLQRRHNASWASVPRLGQFATNLPPNCDNIFAPDEQFYKIGCVEPLNVARPTTQNFGQLLIKFGLLLLRTFGHTVAWPWPRHIWHSFESLWCPLRENAVAKRLFSLTNTFKKSLVKSLQ